MFAEDVEERPEEAAEIGEQPIAEGGRMACAGAAAGPVALVLGELDVDSFPAGGVLLARHSSPKFARVMPRCAASASSTRTARSA